MDDAQHDSTYTPEALDFGCTSHSINNSELLFPGITQVKGNWEITVDSVKSDIYCGNPEDTAILAGNSDIIACEPVLVTPIAQMKKLYGGTQFGSHYPSDYQQQVFSNTNFKEGSITGLPPDCSSENTYQEYSKLYSRSSISEDKNYLCVQGLLSDDSDLLHFETTTATKSKNKSNWKILRESVD